MELNAQKREKLGKATKYLKREGNIPSVIFGKGFESVNISINYIDFVRTFKQAGETELIDLKTDSKKYKVLVKNVQFDPVTEAIIHVEFYKPDLTQKINAQVPVTVIGKEENDVIKGETAMLMLLMQEITVEALPEDLPREFEVDVSNLNEIGMGVKVGELKYDREKVEIPDLDSEDFVIRIDEVIIEEEPEEELSEEEALENLEATEETAGEDGEEGAEGEEKAEKAPEKSEDSK